MTAAPQAPRPLLQLVGVLGLAAMTTGCESVSGSVVVDGQELALVECRRIPGENAVRLETDGNLEIRLADLGSLFEIGIGSGDCLRTEVIMGECTMGVMGGPDDCEPDRTVCVERDLVEFMSCTRAQIDIRENGTSREGQPVVDVNASFDCTSGMRSLSGEVEISNCT